MVDQWAVERMGGPDVIKVGTVFEINDKQAPVSWRCRTQKDFQNIPAVYTTYERALAYAPPERRKLSYVLAKAKDGVPTEELTRHIREQTGLGAFTAQGFGMKTMLWMLKNTGSGSTLGPRSRWASSSAWRSPARPFISSPRKPETVWSAEGHGSRQLIASSHDMVQTLAV